MDIRTIPEHFGIACRLCHLVVVESLAKFIVDPDRWRLRHHLRHAHQLEVDASAIDLMMGKYFRASMGDMVLGVVKTSRRQR